MAIVALAGIFMIYANIVLGSCNGPDKICFNNTGKAINQIIVIVTELALVVLSGFYFVYDFILENSLRNLKNEKDKLSFATCIASSVLLVLFFVGILIAFFVQEEESRVLYAIPGLIFGLAYIGIKLFYLIKNLKKN